MSRSGCSSCCRPSSARSSSPGTGARSRPSTIRGCQPRLRPRRATSRRSVLLPIPARPTTRTTATSSSPSSRRSKNRSSWRRPTNRSSSASASRLASVPGTGVSVSAKRATVRAVRALVVSDTHFGAWTGDDLLRRDWALQRLAPHLEAVDELVVLGDLFDFLFATVPDAFAAADPFFELIAEKMPGKRFVWLAGNHDRHIMARELETLTEEMLATGEDAQTVGPTLRGRNYSLRFMQRRLPSCEVAIEYPFHRIGDVLCCHGHYLDAHVQGSMANRMFTRGLRRVGGVKTHGRTLTIADYEAATGPLTELLYTVAQLPSGTDAQRSLLGEIQRIGAWYAPSPRRGGRPNGYRSSPTSATCASRGPARRCWSTPSAPSPSSSTAWPTSTR